MTSKKTTIAGLITGLALILYAASAIFDGDPDTKFDAERVVFIVTGIAAALGGVWARDDDVSSEGTKAPKDLP